MYATKAGSWPVYYLFKCCLLPVGVYVQLRSFFEPLQLCFHVVSIWSIFMVFPFPYFTPKSFGLTRIRLFIWLYTLPLIVGRTFFVVLELPVFFRLFGFVSVSFSHPSMASIFGWSLQAFLSSFLVSSENFLKIRFSILASWRSLFISDSSLSSHTGFNFLSVVFKGTPIFS